VVSKVCKRMASQNQTTNEAAAKLVNKVKLDCPKEPEAVKIRQ